MQRSRIPDLLGIKYPIIEGVVGCNHMDIAAAVSEAGGLGTIHGGTVAREAKVRERIQEMKRRTNKPFSINIPISRLSESQAEALVNGAIEEGMKVLTTSAGSPRKYTPRLKEAGLKVIHVTATVSQALKAAEAGVDIIVSSGFEAGGWQSHEEVTTFVLIPQVVDAIKGRVPIIAAGGIGDSRGLLAAFCLGAEGVQMGSRFVASIEAAPVEGYSEAVLRASDDSTEIVGRGKRPARNWTLDFLKEVRPGYARPAAGPGGSAGQVAGLIKEILSVEEIIRRMIEGLGAEYARLSAQLAPFMP